MKNSSKLNNKKQIIQLGYKQKIWRGTSQKDVRLDKHKNMFILLNIRKMQIKTMMK